jgi:hypothetical protein
MTTAIQTAMLFASAMTESDPHARTAVALADQVAIQTATLERQLEWIRSADSKVPILVGVSTAMLGALATLLPALFKLSPWGAFWSGIAAFALLACNGASAFAVFPRTDGPPNSLLFFGTIASMTRPEYAHKIINQSEWDHLQDLITQTYRNAEVATLKYRWVKRAFGWLFFSILPWTVAVFLLA